MIIASMAYAGWRYSPLGKIILSNWLLKKWKQQLQQENKVLNVNQTRTELTKLSYREHELLVRLTRLNRIEKEKHHVLTKQEEEKYMKIIQQVRQSLATRKANFEQLENIILPA